MHETSTISREGSNQGADDLINHGSVRKNTSPTPKRMHTDHDVEHGDYVHSSNQKTEPSGHFTSAAKSFVNSLFDRVAENDVDNQSLGMSPYISETPPKLQAQKSEVVQAKEQIQVKRGENEMEYFDMGGEVEGGTEALSRQVRQLEEDSRGLSATPSQNQTDNFNNTIQHSILKADTQTEGQLASNRQSVTRSKKHVVIKDEN